MAKAKKTGRKGKGQKVVTAAEVRAALKQFKEVRAEIESRLGEMADAWNRVTMAALDGRVQITEAKGAKR